MNQQVAIDLYASNHIECIYCGGKGSGCHGDNCGRPATVKDVKQALKHSGYKYLGKDNESSKNQYSVYQHNETNKVIKLHEKQGYLSTKHYFTKMKEDDKSLVIKKDFSQFISNPKFEPPKSTNILKSFDGKVKAILPPSSKDYRDKNSWRSQLLSKNPGSLKDSEKLIKEYRSTQGQKFNDLADKLEKYTDNTSYGFKLKGNDKDNKFLRDEIDKSPVFKDTVYRGASVDLKWQPPEVGSVIKMSVASFTTSKSVGINYVEESIKAKSILYKIEGPHKGIHVSAFGHNAFDPSYSHGLKERIISGQFVVTKVQANDTKVKISLAYKSKYK